MSRWQIELKTPINWDLKLKFFVLPNRPTPSLVIGRRWVRAVRVKDRILPIAVTVDRGAVVVESVGINEIEKEQLNKIIVEYFGFGDASKLYEFMEKDEGLKYLRNKYAGFGRAMRMAIYVYEGIIKAVIQQQIAFKVAENIAANIVERYGERTKLGNIIAYDFPSPKTLAHLSVENLKKCGLSRRKAELIKEIAKTAMDSNLENLRKMEPDEVYEFLTSFKGIGKWTAELVMSMVLGFNVIPLDDLGVRRVLSKLYPSSKLGKIAEKFGIFANDILCYLFLEDRLSKMQQNS